MANKFYQGTQLQGANFRQAVAPNFSTQDRAAQTKYQSISQNLQKLNNVAQRGLAYSNKKAEAKRLNEAQVETYGLPEYTDKYVRTKTQEDGLDFRNLSDEQIKNYSNEARAEYFNEKGLNDKDYAEEANSIADELSLRTMQKLSQSRSQENQEYNIGVITERTKKHAEGVQKGTMDAKDFLESLGNNLERDSFAVEPPSEIQQASEELGNPVLAKKAQLSGLIAAASESSSPELLQALKSEEAKKYFKDEPQYENMINVAEAKAFMYTKKKKQQNYSRIEEQAYSAMEMGAIRTEQDVESFFNEVYNKNDIYRPSSKDIFKLKQKMLKGAKETDAVVKYKDAIDAGDYTWLDNQGFSKEEKEAIITKDAKVDMDLPDFSPATLFAALQDDDKRTNIRAYFDSGKPVPKQLKTWANESPIGGLKGLQQKYTMYQDLVGLTNGTSTSINDIFTDKKSIGEMLFVGNLLDNPSIPEADKYERYIEFKNDLSRNVDQYGVYYNTAAQAALNDEAIKENIMEYSKDAPWTWDDSSVPSYVSREIKSNFAMYMALDMDVDKSLKKAKELFEKNNKYVEAPDGSETILTREFLDVDERRMNEFVLSNDIVKQVGAAKKATKLFGDFFHEGTIGYKPANDYPKSKQYVITIDGVPDGRTRFTREDFNKFEENYRQQIIENRPDNAELQELEQQAEERTRQAIEVINQNISLF